MWVSVAESILLCQLLTLLFKNLLMCVILFTSRADPSVIWTGGEGTVTESEKESVSEQSEKSRPDAEIIRELPDPPKLYPGDYLFQVSFEVKFEGNFKEFEGIEKRVARSMKNLVTEKLSTFSPSLKELLLRSVRRIDTPGLFFIYWLYFNPGGEDVYTSLESRINQLQKKSVANLRHGKAILFSTSVEDVDKCLSGLSMCDPEANCFNAFGFYSCQCAEGFKDRSLTASGTGCVHVKSEIEGLFSGIIFPVRSCHITIRGDSGEFFSPAYPSTYDEYIWCNWTISAPHWKQIELQIHGFISQEDCNWNQDEIVIVQVSSDVVSHVLQACLNKTRHDIIVRALAVQITFFSKGNPNHSNRRFHIKYQVYEDSKMPSTSLDSVLISSPFKIFQQIYVSTPVVGIEAVIDEKLHWVQPKKLLYSEAPEPILQDYGKEWRDTTYQPTARISSRQQSPAASGDLSVPEQRVQISAKRHVSNFAPNILFTQTPSSSCEQPLEFTRQFGPLRTSVLQTDSTGDSSLKPTIISQMFSVNSEWLKPSIKDNWDILNAQRILEASRVERNPATCKFDKSSTFSDPRCHRQISYSATSGFWFSVTFYQKAINPTQYYIQVKDDSRNRGRECSDSRPMVEPQSQMTYKSVDLVHSATILENIVYGITPSSESDQKEYVVNSAHSGGFDGIGTSLLKLFDCTVGRRKMSYKHMQSKIKHHVLCEPDTPTGTANDPVTESALIYSDSFDGMLTLLPTLSLNSYVWMKTKCQNSYTSQDIIQTAIYQNHETELQIVPTYVSESSKANSSVLSSNESQTYEVEWQTESLWILMSFTPSFDAAWYGVATINPVDGTGLLNAEYAVEPSTVSPTPTWTTFIPKLHDDIGHLLKVSAGIELVNVVYKNFRHLEKKVLQSVKTLIMDNLASFSPPLKKIFLQGAKRINSSGFTFDYQLHFGPNGENVFHSLQTRMNKLLNKSVANLRNGQVYLVSVSVEDVDECKFKTGTCGKEAKCLNTIGSYFCHCENGFEDRSMGHSLVCINTVELDSGFWSFGLQEILIGFAICAVLLTSVTLALCFVMYKRSHKKYFRTCDTNPSSITTPTSSEELESEESLIFIPHKSASYVSFTKFQPIPEEPSGQEIDSNKDEQLTWNENPVWCTDASFIKEIHHSKFNGDIVQTINNS